VAVFQITAGLRGCWQRTNLRQPGNSLASRADHNTDERHRRNVFPFWEFRCRLRSKFASALALAAPESPTARRARERLGHPMKTSKRNGATIDAFGGTFVGPTRAAIGSTLLRSPGKSNPVQYARHGSTRSTCPSSSLIESMKLSNRCASDFIADRLFNMRDEFEFTSRQILRIFSDS
jgi:hypothetical protein